MVRYAVIDELDESVRELRRFPEAIAKPTMKPGFRWVPVEDVAAPDYDPLRERLEVVETVMATKLKRTPTKVALDSDSRKANAEAEYQRRIDELVPGDKQIRTLTKGLRIVERRGRKPLSAAEEATLAQLVAVGDWQEAMEARLDALKAEIDADADADLAAGWPDAPGA